MTRDRRQLEDHRRSASYEDDPVVTYSRHQVDRLGGPHEIEDIEPAGPLYDAVEVPQVDRPPPRDAFVPEPDIRVERDFDDRAPFEPEKPRRLRLLVFVGIGVIAVAAGIGVLLASVGSTSRVETAAPGTVPAGDAPRAPAAENGDAIPPVTNIREIPLGGSTGGETVSVPAPPRTDAPATAAIGPSPSAEEPPAPRSRPDQPATATVSPDPFAAEPVETSLPAVPAVPAATAVVPPAGGPAPAGNDDFIDSIERTLSRIEQPAPGPAPLAPNTAALPPAVPGDVFGPPAATFGAGTVDQVIIDDEAFRATGGGHFDFEMDGPPATAALPPTGPVYPAQPGVGYPAQPTPVYPGAPTATYPAQPNAGYPAGTTTVYPAHPGYPDQGPVVLGPAGVVGPQGPQPLPDDLYIVEQPQQPTGARGRLQRLFPRLLGD